MKRPLSVTIAVILQWVAAVIAVFSALALIVAGFEASREGVALQIEGALVNQGIVDVSGESVVTALFLAGTMLLAIAFIRVMVAVYLARGRGWARIVVTAFVLVNLLAGFAYLFQSAWLQGSAIIVVELVVLALLYNGRANAYFAPGLLND